ncbi:hypothetical protein TK11N_13690 [Tetragenococcus koreensis]|uniref:Uncharacterized protein n=1 Tax=Tetragenococcus koreensis TaxID=290335 RepID=A0AAN4RLX3_9ENTE|nr:hypothetical protein TKO01_11300 [Tetragenococcus koreensis]GEQ49517.1 hypothetical protein TK11N_13690 [Tetragenococcus koreensis]GEQ51948.1 hypothetical protein TK12N_12920 [Tetragenococcus koreensis]GEQ54498.1 hypothetical protein TK2N_13420 [Tetragenococcus koreensis]GEQ56965.1 hypothetical protein TK4N_13080 [Tetragenococcus koreensis]
MFTKLFPIKTVDNNGPNFSCNFIASSALLSPSLASFFKRIVLNEVKAVSEDEKYAEKSKQIKNKMMLDI